MCSRLKKSEQAHFFLVTLCVLAIATPWGSEMKLRKRIFTSLALRMFHVKHLRYASNLKFLSMDPSLSLRMTMESLVPIKPHIPSL